MKPLRDGDAVVEALFRALCDADEVQLIPVTRELSERAAHLRAITGLRTPDALHAATAMDTECTLFVTNDVDFSRVNHLPVVVLKDLLEQ